MIVKDRSGHLAASAALLVLSLFVSMLTLGTGRTTFLQAICL
jgi:hypothetical protein